MRYALGLDVGGTKVAGAIISEKGDVLNYRRRLLNCRGDEALEKVFRITQELIDEAKSDNYTLCGIGISVPGAIDPAQKIVQRASNLDWFNLPLKYLAEKRFNLVTEIDLDVRAAALGELLFGVARGLQDFMYVTIGTGIGSGIVIGGKLHYGHHSSSGEIGHCSLEKNGPTCGCGHAGCFEALAGGPAICARALAAIQQSDGSSLLARLAQKHGRVDAKIVFEAATKRDSLALRVVDETVEYIGRGLSILVNLIDPQCIILGGGVGQAGPFFLNRVRASLRSHILYESAKDTPLLPASNPGKIEVMGTAVLVFSRHRRKKASH